MVLVVEPDAVLDGLLVERLQDHVAGPVGGEARAPDGPLPVVPGVAAEAPLVDLAVRRAVERQAHVLELDDGLDRLAGEDLGRVLVDEVVAALDRVEHVPLPVVLLLVAQGGAHPALGGAGVGAGRVQLGQDGRVDPGLGQLDGGPQAGAPGTDDERVVLDHQPAGTTFGQGQDDLRAHHEQGDGEDVQDPQHDRPRRAAEDVADDDAHAHERVEEDEHEHRPVEHPPERAVPAELADPLGGLVGRVVEDVQDEVVAEHEHEQPETGQPHQEPDGQLAAAALRRSDPAAPADLDASLMPTTPSSARTGRGSRT